MHSLLALFCYCCMFVCPHHTTSDSPRMMNRPASTVVHKTDFSDSDDDDDEYEYPEDPVPNANKSMTLPATFSKPPPKLPAPNPTTNAGPTSPTSPGPKLPPGAIQLVAAPPKLPPHPTRGIVYCI